MSSIANITAKITSLDPSQIQILPLANSIGEGNLLTSTKIATAYNIPASTGANIKIGIISLGGGFRQSDIDDAMDDLGLTAPIINFVGVDGATNDYSSNPASSNYPGTLENTLDIVCIAGMVPDAEITLYKGLYQDLSFYPDPDYAAAYNANNSFGHAIQKAVDDDVDIISISWGTGEVLEFFDSPYYCGDFLKAPLANAAAKNISVLVASGDYGSAPTRVWPNVSVDYPAASANVIAVGGTYLTLNGANARITETVYNNSESIPGFGGSGGVSVVTTLPEYQQTLSASFNGESMSLSQFAIGFGRGGRGVPDISAAMNAYGIWLDGNVTSASGTSASAPIMAGMLARFIALNGGRRPPKGAVGFNASLYQNTSSMFDITSGNNASLLSDGFDATVGWDACVGLGAQSNAALTYEIVSSGGLKIQDNDETWQNVANVFVKTSDTTWTAVKKVYVKTSSTEWSQSY